MLLARPFTPTDIDRFQQGFLFYWDILSANRPVLNMVVQELSEDAMVQQAMQQAGVDQNDVLFETIRAVTLLVLIFGFDNVEFLFSDHGVAVVCATIPLTTHKTYLSSSSALCKPDNSIRGTLIAAIFTRMSQECGKDAKGMVQDLMDNMLLDAALHHSLRRYFNQYFKQGRNERIEAGEYLPTMH